MAGMSSSITSVTTVLNSLIKTCNDGQQGFSDAADNVRNLDYKSLFLELASQRRLYLGELRRIVLGLGESAEEHGSVAGAMHRGWLDLKAALTSGDEHTILEECERGEDHAVASYREALESDDLPENIRTMVEQQFLGVQAAHDRVRELRDRTKA